MFRGTGGGDRDSSWAMRWGVGALMGTISGMEAPALIGAVS